MSSPSSDNRQIARAAGTVMLAFIFSNLVGLARNIITTHAFGTQAEMDAFNAANRVAELLFNLVAGGALASAFIPTFTGFLQKNDRPGAWRLASGVVNLGLLILTAVSALAAIFAPQIVKYGLFLLEPDFDPALQSLTIALLRTMLPSVVIFGISGLLMGVLNAHQVFLIPAVAPAMYSLGMIFGTLVLAPSMGIFGLAWGVVIGAGLHLLVQLPALPRLKGRRYFASLELGNRAVGEVVRLMAPRVLGVAVVQINFIVNTIIALSLPEGSVSAITWAFGLMLMPQMAIAQSAAIAALPTFSAQAARGEHDQMRASLAATLRAVLLLAIPASLGLVLLRTPVVALLYQHGEFTANSTTMVAWALLWYALGLVGHSVVEITSRAFYALHDTRTPVMVGVVEVTLNVIFSLWFASWFERLGWLPLGGLALANSLATALEMLALLVLLRRRLKGLQGMVILQGVIKSLLAATVMGVVVIGWLQLARDWPVAVQALGGLALGAGSYGGMALALKMPEIKSLTNAVRRRLKRSD